MVDFIPFQCGFFAPRKALKIRHLLPLIHLSTILQTLDFTGFVGFLALPFLVFVCYNLTQAYEELHTISIVLERGFIYVNDSVEK